MRPNSLLYTPIELLHATGTLGGHAGRGRSGPWLMASALLFGTLAGVLVAL